MNAAATTNPKPGSYGSWLLAAAFCVLTSGVSYVRWANFQYRTFDLAYYVQGIWQLLHGRFEVSIEHVPLLGNHVEPIIFLFVPFFAVWSHPIFFVLLQNAALAMMCPIGYDIARRLQFSRQQALLLAAALLAAPATGYVALHEFHPEALAAPFLLLLIRSRLCHSARAHWLWFCAVLACKENMAFLLIAYSAVGLITDRKRNSPRDGRLFYLYPMLAAAGWFVLCGKVITPALNSGNIDYLSLYARLGGSAGEIMRNAVAHPARVFEALQNSVTQGNLLPGTLLPFLFLPLLRLRWILVAAPIVLQHLLSWRSSEWMIYFHYAAPLIPLFWIAAVEAVVRLRSRDRIAAVAAWLPVTIVGACAAAQVALGPAIELPRALVDWRSGARARAEKMALLEKIPPGASVVAPLPYLSHLATRQHCYSLHYILKGLKTLSRSRYVPPPTTDFVLVDYHDTATFDPSAGYYHPKMKTTDGVLPSSDELLHQFLSTAMWNAEAKDEYTLFAKGGPSCGDQIAQPTGEPITDLGEGNKLVQLTPLPTNLRSDEKVSVVLDWLLDANRETFPWLALVFTQAGSNERHVLVKGLCAPEVREGFCRETWTIAPGLLFPAGSYEVAAEFSNNPKRVWADSNDPVADRALLHSPLPLGRVTITPRLLTH